MATKAEAIAKAKKFAAEGNYYTASSWLDEAALLGATNVSELREEISQTAQRALAKLEAEDKKTGRRAELPKSQGNTKGKRRPEPYL
jgi:hypothetical protein